MPDILNTRRQLAKLTDDDPISMYSTPRFGVRDQTTPRHEEKDGKEGWWKMQGSQQNVHPPIQGFNVQGLQPSPYSSQGEGYLLEEPFPPRSRRKPKAERDNRRARDLNRWVCRREKLPPDTQLMNWRCEPLQLQRIGTTA